jgi:branched-chain amino acid transport system substrate-binding protein
VYSAGHRRLSILYINNDAGVGNKQAFSEEFVRLGGQIISEETYDQDSTDMRSQIAKIIAGKPDGVMIVSYPADTILVMRQAKELGLSVPQFYQTEALDDPAVIKKAGGAAEGATYILPAAPQGSVAETFREQFRKRYGRLPETYAAEAYDAVKIIAQVLAKSSSMSSGALKQGMYDIADYQGASGVITFDAKGEVRKPMAIKQIRDGKAVVIETTD